VNYAVVDIGSPAKGNLGWSAIGPNLDNGGTDPEALIDTLVDVATRGPLALGFEAPMYVPARRDAADLLRARKGEGHRAWSVAAGATTTAIALAIVPWIFGRLSMRLPALTAWQDWTRLPTRPYEVLVFEAFVSGGPSDGHHVDARGAALAAQALLGRTGVSVSSALFEEECMSLLGAALLYSGLTDDTSELRRPCLVVRAEKVLTRLDEHAPRSSKGERL
jgi:hypothetical protein